MLLPCQQRMLTGGIEDKEHAMSQKLDASPAVIGIDIGKNAQVVQSFVSHLILSPTRRWQYD